MPSVEMRRTTRVFGARVLRSGRRLFTTQEELKHLRRPPLAVADAGDDWIELLDHHGGGGGGGGRDLEFKENGWRNSNEENKNGNDEVSDIDDGEPETEIKLGESLEVDSVDVFCDSGDHENENRRWGVVYSRKRKRSVSVDSGSLEKVSSSDKKYGKKFFRKQSRNKKTITEELSFPSVSEVSPPNAVTEQTQSPVEPTLAAKSKSRRKKLTTAINLPLRNGVSMHRGIQKRRSSLRSRIQRNPSSFAHLKAAGGGLAQDGVPFFPIKSNPDISRSIRRANFKELKSTLVELTQDIDSASCNANILMIESDRCYRDGGAVITMEMSDSKQWFLVVKIDGLERCRIEAQNVMRPCFCNRITHAIIWATGDESWKLEFPDRQDWFVFKELYRKCSERSVRLPASLASIIPVPRVNEVSGYADVEYSPFKMPDSYIRSRGDEVSRVLETSNPVYDMDSDDERWLNEFNKEHGSRVDEDTFEKIIDAYERGIYASPVDYSDAISAVDRCLTLASKDVLEAVHGYWMSKRKKKHSALVCVFQFYKPKKTEQLNIKAVLRKKRSFRQRGNQLGRGKQLNFLKGVLPNCM
ncbi:uncharacterized protein LOC112508502 isoform X2 [Cynara cardunculus var. scolymus]|uniref:uncharacterized protein LOC112508502 isoform X2 n=1 Tax=Cynara cardunculus var. scolymus TaxID=59895 RepID=UPI000D629D9A|nr:uncharacterized protein LOC112508502 isoform X2 [Cynara cardunculus var. scolymus]